MYLDTSPSSACARGQVDRSLQRSHRRQGSKGKEQERGLRGRMEPCCWTLCNCYMSVTQPLGCLTATAKQVGRLLLRLNSTPFQLPRVKSGSACFCCAWQHTPTKAQRTAQGSPSLASMASCCTAPGRTSTAPSLPAACPFAAACPHRRRRQQLSRSHAIPRYSQNASASRPGNAK